MVCGWRFLICIKHWLRALNRTGRKRIRRGCTGSTVRNSCGYSTADAGVDFRAFLPEEQRSHHARFLEKRYDSKSRIYLSVVSIIGYVLTKISVTIYAGGIVFEAIGVDFWVGAFVLVVATGIYTIFGGLKAVVYTDMVQMFVLLGGALAITFFGLGQLGRDDQHSGPGIFQPVETLRPYQLPVDRHFVWCSHFGHLVLVYRSIYCATGTLGQR